MERINADREQAMEKGESVGAGLRFPLGSGLQALGLALMAGGMLALGAFTAPTVFGQLPREEAGPIMAVIFRHYDMVLLVALGLVLIGEIMRWTSGRLNQLHLAARIRMGLISLLTGTLLFAALAVNPDIEKMNRTGVRRDNTAQGRRFDEAHKLSESLYKLDMAIAALLLLLTPLIDSRCLKGGRND